MVSLDDYDLLILKEFCRIKNGESTSTWKIMKEIHPEGKEKEHERIKNRIENLALFDLFFIDDKPRTYTLDSDKVFFGKFKFPNGKKSGICVKSKNKWSIFEI